MRPAYQNFRFFWPEILIGGFLLLGLWACSPVAVQLAGNPTGTTVLKTETPQIPTTTPQPTIPSKTPALTATQPTATTRPTKTITPIPYKFDIELRPTVIGYSAAGRPIEIYRFGLGYQERLVIFGIHGGYEWNTIALADELITYLTKNPDFIPKNKRLYLLRAFNPDGKARSHGHSGRYNENKVDLNRNFPVGWLPDWDKAGCWNFLPINAGTGPLSEPEALALARFFGAHQIEALISYHSSALGIFPGGEPPDPASVDLAATLAEVSDYAYPPINTGCQMTGTLVDWAVSQGAAAVDIELTNHEDTDFEQTLTILDEFLRWENNGDD
jgi:hypothetical protein